MIKRTGIWKKLIAMVTAAMMVLGCYSPVSASSTNGKPELYIAYLVRASGNKRTNLVGGYEKNYYHRTLKEGETVDDVINEYDQLYRNREDFPSELGFKGFVIDDDKIVKPYGKNVNDRKDYREITASASYDKRVFRVKYTWYNPAVIRQNTNGDYVLYTDNIKAELNLLDKDYDVEQLIKDYDPKPQTFFNSWNKYNEKSNTNTAMERDVWCEPSFEGSHVVFVICDRTKTTKNEFGASYLDLSDAEIIQKTVPAGTTVKFPKTTSKFSNVSIVSDNETYARGYEELIQNKGAYNYSMGDKGPNSAAALGERVYSNQYVVEKGSTSIKVGNGEYKVILFTGTKKGSSGSTTAAKSVKLNKTSCKLDVSVNKTIQLDATVKPETADQYVEWSSDHPEIADVDISGFVNAYSKGKATITAKTSNGKKAKCKITVSGPIEVKSVKLNKKTATLDLAKKNKRTVALKASFTPSNPTDKRVKWSSSDKNIATVKADSKNPLKAVVTGKHRGPVTITVTSRNGQKATCNITVKEPVWVSGVSLDKEEQTIAAKKNFTLVPTIIPADATNKKLKWSSSDKKIATVSSKGKVTGKKPGEVTVTVTTVDGGYTASCKVKVTEEVKKK